MRNRPSKLLASLCLLAATVATLLGGLPARAGGFAARLDAAVHRALDDDAGWQHHGEKDGVALYRKAIPGLGLTAFKGVKRLDPRVDPARLFHTVTDIDRHPDHSEVLLESRVVRRGGSDLGYYQVMEPPAFVPGSTRYWICTSRVFEDVGGEPGRLKRSWSAAPADTLDEVRADLARRFPKAVPVRISHGSWELDPQPDGSVLFIYRTVSDPGGSIPASVARMLASRTLPDNMLVFERAARSPQGAR